MIRQLCLLALGALLTAADPAPRTTEAKPCENVTLRCVVPGNLAAGSICPTLLYAIKPGTQHVDEGVTEAIARAGIAIVQLVADQQPTPAQAAVTWAAGARRAARDAGVVPRPLFIIGFSASAASALQIAFSEPGEYAGAIAVCHLLSNPPATAIAKSLPILLLTGPADMNHAAILALSRQRYAGYACDLRDLPGLGHQLRLAEVPLIVRWIAERTPKPAKR